MCSSAMRSSSRISIPGSRCSATTASVSERRAPARAIPSISAWDLRMIIGRLRADRVLSPGSHEARERRPTSSARLHRLERLLDLVEDLVDAAVGMDADDVRLVRAVIVDQRRRLAFVELEPSLDHLGCVVRAPLLRCAAEEALQKHLTLRHLKVEDDVELSPQLTEELVERLRLRH